MLRIDVYTPNGKQPLAIDDGSLSVVVNSTLLGDSDEGIYSIPYELPVTPQNNAVLGFKNGMDATLLFNATFEVDICEYGIPVFSRAKMHIVDMEINGGRGSYSITVVGHLNHFANATRNQTLADVQIPIFSTGTRNSRDFATAVMKNTTTDPLVNLAVNKVAFAPIYWEDFIDESREDYDAELLGNGVVNFVFSSGGTWSFNRQNPASPTSFVPSGSTGYSDYKTIPFFKLRYVLEMLFSMYGYRLKGNVLLDVDFNNMAIFNNYAIDKTVSQNNVDPNRIIDARNHLPKTPIKDFIKALCLVLGAEFTFHDNNTVSFDFVEDKIAEHRIDISPYMLDLVRLSAVQNSERGLSISWKWDANDGLVNDKLPDLKPDLIKAWVQLPGDIAAVSYGTPKDGDLIYCYSENYYYAYSQSFNKWLYFCEGQQDYKYGTENVKIEINCSPLLQAKGVNNSVNNYSLYMLGTKQAGSYFTNRNVFVNNDFEFRLFYIKMHNVGGTTIPISYTHDRLSNGEKVANVSLNLTSENSITRKRLKSLANMLFNGNRMQVSLVLPIHFNQAKLMDNPVWLNNVAYLVEKAEIEIGSRETKLNLIKI